MYWLIEIVEREKERERGSLNGGAFGGVDGVGESAGASCGWRSQLRDENWRAHLCISRRLGAKKPIVDFLERLAKEIQEGKVVIETSELEAELGDVTKPGNVNQERMPSGIHKLNLRYIDLEQRERYLTELWKVAGRSE